MMMVSLTSDGIGHGGIRMGLLVRLNDAAGPGADLSGSAWQPLKAPAKKLNGDDWACDISNPVRDFTSSSHL